MARARSEWLPWDMGIKISPVISRLARLGQSDAVKTDVENGEFRFFENAILVTSALAPGESYPLPVFCFQRCRCDCFGTVCIRFGERSEIGRTLIFTFWPFSLMFVKSPRTIGMSYPLPVFGFRSCVGHIFGIYLVRCRRTSSSGLTDTWKSENKYVLPPKPEFTATLVASRLHHDWSDQSTIPISVDSAHQKCFSIGL